MDIRTLSDLEKKQPYHIFKYRIENNESDVLKKIKFNKKVRSLKDLEMFIELLRDFNKDNTFINEVIRSTPIIENSVKQSVMTNIEELRTEIKNEPDNLDLLFKQYLMNSNDLIDSDIGEGFNDGIDNYDSIIEEMTDKLEAIEEQILDFKDYRDFKDLQDDKRNLIKSISIILKMNNIDKTESLKMNKNIKLIDTILSNNVFKEIQINNNNSIVREDVPNHDNKKNLKSTKKSKYKQDNRPRLTLKKRDF